MYGGLIRGRMTADAGISINLMVEAVKNFEALIKQQSEVETVFSTIGGRIFGRSQYEASNKSSVSVQLKPRSERGVSSDEWIERVTELVEQVKPPGVRVRMWTKRIRGVRLGRGDNKVSLRFQGPDLDVLASLGDELVLQLRKTDGIRWAAHSAEEINQELAITVDRERAATLGLSVKDVGDALRFALQGEVVSQYIEGDRSYDIRVRLSQADMSNPQDIESIVLFGSGEDKPAIYLGDVADVNLNLSPAKILFLNPP